MNLLEGEAMVVERLSQLDVALDALLSAKKIRR
jgi:hypothetical protein